MSNRLSSETSPYLLQHADNPVDWYPWGDEALERARSENKPILLSVGYSACHWCHVMERESFCDAEIAATMNEHFVNIKVDREERPDVDEIYMRAVQALNQGRGGWPMTVFLHPDGRPYWGGTYFPPHRRGPMPGFDEVLEEMARLYRDHPDHVDRIGAEMADYLDRTSQMPPPQRSLRGDWLERVSRGASEAFDDENGGIGTAPKFPPHGLLPVWLAHWRTSGDVEALRRATKTLDGMAKGGMYDVLAGGFCRYSVDAEWRVPHFEKMLYDNGQLIAVYVDAYKATGEARYARVVRESVGWLLREMRLECGAFAASTDADSEGVEGRFFAWTPEQIEAICGPGVAEKLEVTADGTFEHGTSVLRIEEDARPAVEKWLPKLYEERSKRVAPARDDKVIVAWNGLAISALARAGAAFGEPEWVSAASTAATFLLDTVSSDGRLLRTYKDGRAHVLACADDYANLLTATLDLWEATFDQTWLVRANELANQLVTLFWDDHGGGLYFTGSDAPALVTRSKNLSGGAEPSANGMAALAFVRLARLCGRADLGELAATILGGLQPTLVQVPHALGVEAIAGHWWTQGGLEVGLALADGDDLVRAVRETYLPTAVIAGRRKDESYDLLRWMLGKRSVDSATTAYVCQGYTCKLPTTDPDELRRLLDDALVPAPPKPPVRVRAPELPTDPVLWIGSEPMSLQDLRGNIVVLDFWTYCCINCMHVLPALAAVEERFEGEPVVVIGVHSAKFDAEKVRGNVVAAMERYGIRHPVVLDPEHGVWSTYAVRSWPTIAVLDPTGRVAWDQPGEVSADVLVARVEELLDEGRERGTLGEAVWKRADAPAKDGGLRFPGKVSVWEGTHLYVSDSGNGRVLEYALDEDLEATVIRAFDGFVDPQGTARWGDRLYVADAAGHRLSVVHLDTGQVEVLAGTGRLGRGGTIDPDDPLAMDLRSPWDVVVSGEGDEHVVFVAMAGTHQIWIWLPEQRRFGPLAGSGREEHIDGSFEQAALAQPSGMVLLGPYLFFADSEISSIRALDLQERTVGTVVGAGLFDFGDVDGAADQVLLQHPLDVAAHGNQLFVADTYNGKIKRFDLHSSAMATIADGLWEPGGLAVLGDQLIVADTNRHRIVTVALSDGDVRLLTE